MPSSTLGQLLPEAVSADSPLVAVAVRQVRADSREVQPGDLFVAIPGLRVDGHDYAEQAVRAGAVALVTGRPLTIRARGGAVPCVVVEDPAWALGLMASRLFGQPSNGLQVVGITGTNGKTTTAFLLEAMLQAAGRPTGLIGTVAYRYGGHSEPAPYTTPTPTQLHGTLQRMVEVGCSHAVMEVSSHGLQLGRLWGCAFAVAAFSQLTQDHLDLHQTMEAYLQAKTLLFSQHLRAGGTAVVNVDGAGSDDVVATVERRTDLRLLRCSRRDQRAEVQLHDLCCDLDGLRATLVLEGQQASVTTPLIGDYNADNLLLAAGCAHALGVDSQSIGAGARGIAGVPGRLERVDAGMPFSVLVDYAHTPDALACTLDVLRPLCQGRLIVVFGCGGDRDRTKRPLMGRAAAKRADVVVVTSDNPREEDPRAIIDAIVPPIAEQLPLVARPGSSPQRVERGYQVQLARDEAIRNAVDMLEPGDILLIAGKGHEDYQIIDGRRTSFDDREQARQALRERKG